jgi:hypothetical protein
MRLPKKNLRSIAFLLIVVSGLMLLGSCSVFRKKNCIPCPQWSFEPASGAESESFVYSDAS